MAESRYGTNMDDPGGVNASIDSLAHLLQQRNQHKAEMQMRQQTEDRMKKEQLAEFLQKGVQPNAAGYTPAGQAYEQNRVGEAQFQTAGRDAASPRSQGINQYIGQMTGQPAPNINAVDSEKLVPMISTHIKGTQAAQLTDQKAILDQQALDRESGMAQGIVDKYSKQGGKVNARMGHVDISQAQPDPLQEQLKLQQKLGKEAQAVSKLVEPHLKPIKMQLDASENTINYLDQGNPVADKAALLSETAVALGGVGGKAFGQVMAQLSGDPTMAQDTQRALNWLNNTSQISLQPAQRNAIREMVLLRMPTLQQQYQSVKKQISSQIPNYAAMHTSLGQVQPLIDNTFGSIDEAFKRTNESSTKYMEAKAQAGNPAISRPSTFSQSGDNPGTIQQLKDAASAKFRQLIGSPASPQPQQSPQSGQPMSFEEYKRRKAAGTL